MIKEGKITEFDKMTYEEEKKKIAKIVYTSPFLSGVQKLNKTQLIILIYELIQRLDIKINLNDDYEIDERDFKDLAWDRKCIIVETLNPKIYKEE